MSVALYFDVHVRAAIAEGLRLRGVDVLTAQEDGATRMEDSDLLDRAGELGRVNVSLRRRGIGKKSDAPPRRRKDTLSRTVRRLRL